MRGYLYLLMASFLWGTTFVAQLTGMEGIGPFTYGMGRYIIGFFVVLIIWAAFRQRRQRSRDDGSYVSGWKFGIGAGCIMFVASAFQQFALLFTTAGKTAFITCLYIVFVPLFARLIGKRIRLENWLGAFVAVAGLYCLSVHDELELNYGDVLAFICSIFWAFHILFIDRYAERADNIELSASQLAVCA
ncbi:MAG: DMT family transporter, partial [Anaerovibrio sp.]|nr:DMT family transporter [Anaerovibrio sp.]